MKKIILLNFVLILGIFYLNGCSSCERKPKDGENSDSLAINGGDGTTYCVWDKAAVWDQPKKDAKYIAGLTLGESVTFLDERETDGEGNKEREYLKIRLNDGTEGWTQANLLAVDSKPAVFKSPCKIYSRPDLLKLTNKSFMPFDFVAITEEKGDWLHVTGKRTGGTWIEDGWIRSGSISNDDKDIAIASFVNRANIKYASDDVKLKEELEKIRDNDDLQGSPMHDALAQLIQDNFYPSDIGGDAGVMGDGEIEDDVDVDDIPVDTAAVFEGD